jgi:hypothetical protein
MRLKGSKSWLGLAAGMLFPLVAGAQNNTVILNERCSLDSLDTAQATARVEWARKCGIQGGATLFNTWAMAAPDYSQYLYDYNEGAAYKFSGDTWGHDVNYTYVNELYLSGPTFQSTDYLGYKWARPIERKKARPYYPTFGSSPVISSGVQLFPHPTLADCRIYSDRNGQYPVSAFYVNGYCEASCYTPEQKLLFSEGELPIAQAYQERRTDLISLSERSTLDQVELVPNRTYSYTREIRDAEHKVIEITTASGGFLRVTDEHPVIQGDGRIVQARTLKVGNDLLKADGSPDEITQVQKTTFHGLVYNLRPVTTDRVSNVLVAQGFLVGSSVFQNDEIGYMNRMLLFRSSVPPHVIP